jgi:gas vesicle protein
MTDIATLRMAAIAAVLAASSSGEDLGQIARKSGEAWARDHRRMNMGHSSLLYSRSARSPWR